MKNFCRSSFLILVALLMLAMPVRAQDSSSGPANMTVIDKGTIKDILKSDLIMLDNNKRYRLDNILVPPDQDPAAIDALKTAFMNKPVTIYTYHDVNDNLDRYGVPFAHIITGDGVWIQQDLVSKGLAWAFSSEASPQMAGILKRVEATARAQKLGFWANPVYAIKRPDIVHDFENSYQIVQGKIVSVTEKPSGAVFLNFSTDWKTGFSVRIANNFKTISTIDDPLHHTDNNLAAQWKDRVVRVRGWVSVTSSGAPMIDVADKEQIDFVPQSGR